MTKPFVRFSSINVCPCVILTHCILPASLTLASLFKANVNCWTPNPASTCDFIYLFIFFLPANPTLPPYPWSTSMGAFYGCTRGAWLGTGSHLAVSQLLCCWSLYGLLWMSGVLCRFKESLRRSGRSQDALLDRFVSLDKSLQVFINHLLPLRPIVH